MQGPVFIYVTPGILLASCRRSIFTLATSILAYAGKVCHIAELSDFLQCSTFSNVSLVEKLMLHLFLSSIHIFQLFIPAFALFYLAC
jgi:hypothetical protein